METLKSKKIVVDSLAGFSFPPSIVEKFGKYKIIPTFLLKYKFETYKYIQKVKSPILIIHGDIDSVIPFEASQQLSQLFKKGDKFYPITNQGHDDFEKNGKFLKAINRFLEK